ncbi:hypothetical protein [Pontibacter harenae]|uniref:hypothetical protein n=1 Tax=Pontibacter harenae TaxID=2894083 RepID=UPI001E2E32A9|nr:hypothetical protein [Pontibacter harenae]MCC9167121.1 hypothetical protein [Pontibacter harenae]
MTLDTPYDESINSNCKLLLGKWNVDIENLKQLLLKNKAYTLGNIFQEIHQTSVAKKYYKQVVNSKYSDLYRGKAFIGLADVYKTQWDSKSHFKVTQDALKIANRLKDETGRIACFIHLGIYYKRKGSFGQALRMHKDAFNVIYNSKSLDYMNNQSELSEQHYHIGIIERAKGNNDESLSQLSRAEGMAEIVGDEHLFAHILKEKGSNYEEMIPKLADISSVDEFRKEALKFYKLSLEKATALAIPTLIIENLIHIGRLSEPNIRKENLAKAAELAQLINISHYQDKVKKEMDKI